MTNTETITLITGATRGMGREMAKELGLAGQHIIVGARKTAAGEAVVAELSELGITADTVQLDVTDPVSVKAAFEEIKSKFGYLSILINNAGIAVDNFEAPSSLALERIRKDFEVNFFGLINVTQTILPLLKIKKDSKIINMSSMMGSIGSALDPESGVYNASAAGYQSSKAALNMFSVQLAKELEKTPEVSITVNLIDPGMVATEFGSGDAELAKSMGAKPIEDGVKQAVALALAEKDQRTATFTNTEGVVPW